MDKKSRKNNSTLKSLNCEVNLKKMNGRSEKRENTNRLEKCHRGIENANECIFENTTDTQEGYVSNLVKNVFERLIAER